MGMPSPYVKFKERYPELTENFEKLGVQCQQSGPLDGRARRLVKLGMAIATASRGGVKSQVRKALGDGFSKEEIRHAAVLALPTIGFPTMIAAIGWMEEVFAE